MKKRTLAVTMSAVMAASMFASVGVSAEEEFNWKAYEGTTLNVMFNEHTYANAII